MLGTQEQFQSLLRTGFQVLGGVLGTYGYMTGGTWEAISGPVITLLVLGYSMWLRRPTGLVQSASKVPGVAIQAPAAIADAIPNGNVTAK